MSAMEIDDQPLVDPFLAVNEELHDLICQHFTGKEVKDLSTVSKQWKYSIGVSPGAMKKIALVYVSRYNRSKDMTEILTSERRFVNVKLGLVKIPRITRNQQLQVVEKISPWVKDLEVNHSLIGDVGLRFPKVERLNVLQMANFTTSIINSVNATKLKVLCICLMYDKDIQPIVDFLMKCKNLEELHLMCYQKAYILDTKFPFKLKSFVFDHYLPLETPDLPSYEKFLQAHSTLQYFQLHEYTTDTLRIALKSLPLLKKLKLSSTLSIMPVVRQLPLSPSVLHLECQKISPNALSVVLAALPNLRCLQLDQMCNKMIQVIASNAMNLNETFFKIYSETFVSKTSSIDVINYYETLKLRLPNINQQIQFVKT